jgi:hypothetical protein
MRALTGSPPMGGNTDHADIADRGRARRPSSRARIVLVSAVEDPLRAAPRCTGGPRVGDLGSPSSGQPSGVNDRVVAPGMRAWSFVTSLPDGDPVDRFGAAIARRHRKVAGP